MSVRILRTEAGSWVDIDANGATVLHSEPSEEPGASLSSSCGRFWRMAGFRVAPNWWRLTIPEATLRSSGVRPITLGSVAQPGMLLMANADDDGLLSGLGITAEEAEAAVFIRPRDWKALIAASGAASNPHFDDALDALPPEAPILLVPTLSYSTGAYGARPYVLATNLRTEDPDGGGDSVVPFSPVPQLGFGCGGASTPADCVCDNVDEHGTARTDPWYAPCAGGLAFGVWATDSVPVQHVAPSAVLALDADFEDDGVLCGASADGLQAFGPASSNDLTGIQGFYDDARDLAVIIAAAVGAVMVLVIAYASFARPRGGPLAGPATEAPGRPDAALVPRHPAS